jgi:hypothetical protein
MLFHHLRCNPVRIVSDRHVGEVCTIVNALPGRLGTVISAQGSQYGLETRLMEVCECEALLSIESDFVGG